MGLAGLGVAWHGLAWGAWLGLAWHGLAWCGGLGLAWHGLAWGAWLGLAWHGLAWCNGLSLAAAAAAWRIRTHAEETPHPTPVAILAQGVAQNPPVRHR